MWRLRPSVRYLAAATKPLVGLSWK